jgi:two-component system CitB family sensor kinase
LYVITGLIEMGEYDEVSAYLEQASNTPSSIARGLKTRIEAPRLAALLLAKITVAAEQQISLIVTEDSHLSASPAHEQILLTIVGNLIDNAIDAVSPQDGIREIVITLHDEHGVHLVVRDNGPGIPADHIDDVLLDGYSTKPSRPGTRRGLGLAIVSRLVFRAGGTIAITSNGGASFAVTLPEESHESEKKSERRVEHVG